MTSLKLTFIINPYFLMFLFFIFRQFYLYYFAKSFSVLPRLTHTPIYFFSLLSSKFTNPMPIAKHSSKLSNVHLFFGILFFNQYSSPSSFFFLLPNTARPKYPLSNLLFNFAKSNPCHALPIQLPSLSSPISKFNRSQSPVDSVLLPLLIMSAGSPSSPPLFLPNHSLVLVLFPFSSPSFYCSLIFTSSISIFHRSFSHSPLPVTCPLLFRSAFSGRVASYW
jgi:hypothetical protein